MFESIKKRWKRIQEDPPGKRFRRQYQRRHEEGAGFFNKVLFIGIGILIVLGGIFLLPAPGPGMLVIFIGLGLISQESLWMATILDDLEVYLRTLYDWGKKVWQQASVLVKTIIVILTLLICILVLYGAYVIFLT